MAEQPQVRGVPWRVRWRPRREVAARMHRPSAHAHRGVPRRRAQLRAVRGRAGAQVRIPPRPIQRQEVLHEEPHAADEVRVLARASEQAAVVPAVGARGIRRTVPARLHATPHLGAAGREPEHHHRARRRHAQGDGVPGVQARAHNRALHDAGGVVSQIRAAGGDLYRRLLYVRARGRGHQVAVRAHVQGKFNLVLLNLP